MKIINIVLLVLITLQLIACGGAKERKAAYMEKANKSLKAGDLDKARIELKNVLQIDPKDAQAYFKLGNVFEQKKDYNKAFGYYYQAAQLQSDNSEYQAKLGSFYLLGGDVDKATEKMELIFNKDKNDQNGLLLKAGILLKQNKIEEAKNISWGIYKKYPDNIENVIFLSTVFDMQKDYTNAIQVLEKSISENPANDKLPLLLANALFLNKNFDKAEEVLKKILSAHPDVFQNYMTLAKFYQQIERPDKTEKTLRAAISADQNDAHRKIVLVQFLKQTKGNDAAITELEAMIKKNPEESDLQLALAGLQLESKNVDEAIATYKNIINNFSEDQPGIDARVQLASIYMSKNNVKDASAIINKAAEVAPNDSQVNFVKAKIEIYNGEYNQAIASLRTVVKSTPDNIEAYILLAASHRSINENDQAKDVMARAFENNRGNAKALLQLANYYVQIKDVDGAEKVVDAFLLKDAKNYEALSIKAGILNGKKNYSEAEKLAKKVILLYPDKDNGYVQSVPKLLSEKKYDDAIRLLKTGYKKSNSPRILKLISEIQIASGKQNDTIDILKSINNNDESLQILLATAYVKNHEYASAEKVLLKSIEQDKTRTESYLSLAKVYLAENNSQKCISILNQGIAANPSDLRISGALAGYYEKVKDYDNAIQVYETVLAISPDNIIANNNLAVLIANHKDDPASLKRAGELVDKIKVSKQPPIMDTVGWVYYKTGNYSDAIKILKAVVVARPDFQVFNYHLGMAYYKSGDMANAKIYLKKSLENQANFEGSDEARKILKLL